MRNADRDAASSQMSRTKGYFLMRFWWVNQNQTFESEIGGGYLWSPKTKKDGGRNQFYENMKLVAPGDIIFSFFQQHIGAIGIAEAPAIESVTSD